MDYGNSPAADLFGGRRGDIVDEGWLKSMNELVFLTLIDMDLVETLNPKQGILNKFEL